MLGICTRPGLREPHKVPEYILSALPASEERQTNKNKQKTVKTTLNFILSSHNKYEVNIVRMLMDLHMHLTWAPGSSFGTGAYLGLPSPQAKSDRLKNGEVRRLELYFVALYNII